MSQPQLIDQVIENAALPASASASPTSTTVSQHNLRDQLAAADKQAANAAIAGGRSRGLGFVKLKFPGAN